MQEIKKVTEEEIKKLPFLERVLCAQYEIKAPKDQKNEYGKIKFSYRSAEDIYKSAKPINLKYGLLLTLPIEKELIDGKVYVTAIATLRDVYSDKVIEVPTPTPIPVSRNMDETQSAGSAISYARKYALGGLYLIDDSKDDPDSMPPVTTFNERRGAVLNRMIAFDKAHDKDEGDTFKYIVRQKANAEDVTEQNIKFIEDNMTFLENQYNK